MPSKHCDTELYPKPFLFLILRQDLRALEAGLHLCNLSKPWICNLPASVSPLTEITATHY